VTPPAEPAFTAGGTARELPAGRLRSFEDDDESPDLASLLTRRSPRSRQRTGSPAPDPGGTRGVEAPTVQPGEESSESPRRRSARSPAAQRGDTASHRDTVRKNRIHSSSVHIPSALIDRIIAERERSGRSNGEIIIAALESTHSQLNQLIQRRDPTGGSLFATRPSRGARLTDGPLTPLNVRLYEADYDVIDQLVEKFGAFSRGHLISAALTAYFDRR
jgi:hypothetical protein